jgi:hypothetical protein
LARLHIAAEPALDLGFVSAHRIAPLATNRTEVVMDEFVKVTFPRRRQVYVDGKPSGFTNDIIQVQTGTHTFDLGATIQPNRQGNGHACAPAQDHRVQAPMTARAWRPAAVALVAFLAAGCASFPETERLEKGDTGKGYR